jgi:hypothetical protein
MIFPVQTCIVEDTVCLFSREAFDPSAQLLIVSNNNMMNVQCFPQNERNIPMGVQTDKEFNLASF